MRRRRLYNVGRKSFFALLSPFSANFSDQRKRIHSPQGRGWRKERTVDDDDDSAATAAARQLHYLYDAKLSLLSPFSVHFQLDHHHPFDFFKRGIPRLDFLLPEKRGKKKTLCTNIHECVPDTDVFAKCWLNGWMYVVLNQIIPLSIRRSTQTTVDGIAPKKR